ncbi:uncharacterized protein, partial [Diabrotica undecimpunctata]|uniref:uncharacterized protein n=1 Tax=Diabrotica undecimpunctata TaxID=50387 RepID=UPI003B6339E4
MMEVYSPCKELSINESMLSWRGRLSFRQYLPGKRHKYGIKFYVLAEPNGLTMKLIYDLCRWIEDLATKEFPRKREEILNSVQTFLTENPRPNPFKNNRPGDSWLKAFLKSHPTTVQRTSEAVSSASACVSEADIRKWFKDINSYLVSKNLIINDPSRIYNGDESGFQICPETGKVFARKGAKNVYSVEKGSSKESITVMFSFSASGIICPPMIIYPYKRIPEKISQTVRDPDWDIGRSDNGWMTAETFYDYVKKYGHKSHLTYELSRLCTELNIKVIALYPNVTRILQPCDVAVFRPVKVGWKKAIREFHEQNPGEVVNKMTFAQLLEKVVANKIKRDTFINGFRVCGLFPFNPDAVDYTKCLGNKKERPE